MPNILSENHEAEELVPCGGVFDTRNAIASFFAPWDLDVVSRTRACVGNGTSPRRQRRWRWALHDCHTASEATEPGRLEGRLRLADLSTRELSIQDAARASRFLPLIVVTGASMPVSGRVLADAVVSRYRERGLLPQLGQERQSNAAARAQPAARRWRIGRMAAKRSLAVFSCEIR